MDQNVNSVLSEKSTNIAMVKPQSKLPKMSGLKAPTPVNRANLCDPPPPFSLMSETLSANPAAAQSFTVSSVLTKSQTLKNSSAVGKRGGSADNKTAKRARLDSFVNEDFTSSVDASYVAPVPTRRQTVAVVKNGNLPCNSRPQTRGAPTKAITTSRAGMGPQSKVVSSATNLSTASSRFPVPTTAAITAFKPPTGPAPGKPKRAAWDLKGRLEDMEGQLLKQSSQNNSMQQQMMSSNERIAMLENMNVELSGTVRQKEQQTSEASSEIQNLQRKLRETTEELASVRRESERILADAETSRSALVSQNTSLQTELLCIQQEVVGLKLSIAQLSASQAGVQAELFATKAALEKSNSTSQDRALEIERLNVEITSLKSMIASCEAKIRTDEGLRRKLHNTILELKGNIRVFMRVRPLLGNELICNPSGTITHIHLNDDDPRQIALEKPTDISPNESMLGGVASKKSTTSSTMRHEFLFDHVFGPSSTQAEIFEEISQLVQSALDGYNVCIFAYGQTGSGKTFTMEGVGQSGGYSKRFQSENADFDNCRGVIPRAVEQIFSVSTELRDKGWQYEFTISYLEIYNETIRDLLSNKEDLKHEIRMVTSNSNEVYVTDLATFVVSTPAEVHMLLSKACQNRSVAETKCNEHSSRSHSVFRLKIVGHNPLTDESCNGLLNLVDLAGSERLKESGSEGQRLTETKSINKSLTELGNVITALSKKENHIPYRNSKLTHLLQNCLGGSSKMLMFVNVSPKEECFQETLNSLRFAKKVNECNIGTAQKKVGK